MYYFYSKYHTIVRKTDRQMPAPHCPKLIHARVYRTCDLAPWGKNPSRLARRLEREGVLRRLGHGLFVYPRRGKFGPVPPTDMELLHTFLGGTPFVITGSERWNALDLGTTVVFAAQLVYNTKRSGHFEINGRTFLLRRVAFPKTPTPEWFTVDLIQHHEMASISLEMLERSIAGALTNKSLDREELRKTARQFGTKATQALVDRASESIP